VRERKTCPAEGRRNQKSKIKNPLQPGVSLVLLPRERKGG